MTVNRFSYSLNVMFIHCTEFIFVAIDDIAFRFFTRHFWITWGLRKKELERENQKRNLTKKISFLGAPSTKMHCDCIYMVVYLNDLNYKLPSEPLFIESFLDFPRCVGTKPFLISFLLF